MATRIQRAVPAFLYYLSYYRGEGAMIFCRNGHNIVGTIYTVDYRTDLIWLSNAIVRRGEHAREISLDYTSVNAFGVLAIVLTGGCRSDTARVGHAEMIWRMVLEDRERNRAQGALPTCEDYRGLQQILEISMEPLTGRRYVLRTHK